MREAAGVASKVFPTGADRGSVSPCPAGVPRAPRCRGTSLVAGEGREETPTLLSSQSCAHFAAGSGQCQHLWCCHRPGMPLSHPGRSRRGRMGTLPHPGASPASRGSFTGHRKASVPGSALPLSPPGAAVEPDRPRPFGAACWLAQCPPGSVRCPQVQLPGGAPLPSAAQRSLSELSHILAQVLACPGGHQGHGGAWEGRLEPSRSVGSEHPGVLKGPLHLP